MKHYESYHCSVQGYSHLKTDKPCQDCSDSYSSDKAHIIVAADGHGDRNCPRSGVGAQMACECAMQELKLFSDALTDHPEMEAQLLEGGGGKLFSALFSHIHSRWSRWVLDHAASNPLTEEELSLVSETSAAYYRSGQYLTHLYGTTLIAAIVTENLLLAFQQGDGLCTVINPDGSAVHPIPEDPQCFGRYSTSMCNEDAVLKRRFAVRDLRKEPIMAVYICSDGVENSFLSLDTADAYLGMMCVYYLEEGRDYFLDTLEEHLSSVSKAGSRDDISISAIVDKEAVSGRHERLQLNYERQCVRVQNLDASNRLKSMQYKMSLLEKKAAEAEAEVLKQDKAVRKTGSILSVLYRRLQRTQLLDDEVKRNLEEAKKRFLEAKANLDEFRRLREQVLEEKEKSGERFDQLSERMAALDGEKPVDAVPIDGPGSLPELPASSEVPSGELSSSAEGPSWEPSSGAGAENSEKPDMTDETDPAEPMESAETVT